MTDSTSSTTVAEKHTLIDEIKDFLEEVEGDISEAWDDITDFLENKKKEVADQAASTDSSTAASAPAGTDQPA